ncbi:MAG: MotA/TolQ/ExbB proton channel family protein [Planctomycetota bacterium]|nr:MotA/TolQ/ExbB proton channel family protein [Planctomycetota bacterium]
MDLATIIGCLLSFGLVFQAMAGGSGIGGFIDVPSLGIVFGGTIGSMLMNFPMRQCSSVIKVTMHTLIFKMSTPTDEIERIVEYANLARREGLLALEDKLQSVEDPFFAKGIQLVIDGFPVETVRDIMELEADWQFQRHSAGRKVLESAAATAPAFGMVGTLIGLVKMLANLSNPDDIGAGMSVALLTTLYGAMLANMVLIPLAGKLEVRAKEEVLLRDLMVEGIVAIQSGEKPQLIKEKLKSFLAPSARAAIED